MSNSNNRRQFLRQMGMYTMGLGMLPAVLAACNNGEATRDEKDSAAAPQADQPAAKELFFKISLAEWSFHKALFAGKMNHLDFASRAKNEFGIEGIEYVNQFFKDKAKDQSYLDEMKKRADDLGDDEATQPRQRDHRCDQQRSRKSDRSRHARLLASWSWKSKPRVGNAPP